jgi:hypothetical protein
MIPPFEVSICSQGVWLCFERTPSLDDIQSARDMLDKLTDDMIGDEIAKQYQADK